MSNTKKWLIALGSVLGVAAVLAGLFVFLRLNRDPAKVYSVAEFSQQGGNYDGSSLSGSVTTDRMQTVYLSETQEVTKILVQEGDELKKGDPILEFNTSLTELQLKRKDLEIQKLEQDMEKTKKEYKQLLGYSYKPTAAAASTEGVFLSMLTSPETQRGIHLSLLANGEGEPAPDEPTEPSEEPSEPSEEPTEPSEEPSEPTEPSEEPTEPTEPSEEPTEPTEPSEEATEPTEESTEPTEESTEPTEPVDEHLVEDYKLIRGSGTLEDPYLVVAADGVGLDEAFIQQLLSGRDQVHVVFAQCEENRTDNPITGAWGMTFTRKDGGWTFSFLDANGYVGQIPEPGEDSEEPVQPDPMPIFPDDPGGGGGYSPSELKKMKAEMEQKLKELDIKIRMAKVEYTRMEREMGDGTIYADFDGVVLNVGDPDTAYQNREPVVKISGGGGYLVNTAVDELSLENIEIGQTMTVVSYWGNYGEYEATVSSISPYPTTNRYGWSENQNLSYYPVTLTIPADADLQDGSWVDINVSQVGQNDDAFYLMKAFILQENGKSYVYVRNEDERLEKREITTGRDLWGWQLEITSGLSLEDYVAFPYGKTVTDGAKTEEGSPEDLYGGY